ncbi:hypothetical protein DEU53_104322 [Pantoea sp. AG1095]|uniref:hypothetical protein n=1 Tax=Pantoea sp. AG1095 TaxID=2184004 RepID=UPI000D923CB8|nr:hypothetical protein [Pantoea sp. AG1095]PYG49362.1 hypothetical protein DEU53_104322 [Pantoea sp. AG1095]
MDGDLALKFFVGLAAIASIWLDFRPNKRKQNADPAIAEADERERAVSGTFPCSELRKTPLMVSALLHGYAVKSLLQGLAHADVENVRCWHEADARRRSAMSEKRTLLK